MSRTIDTEALALLTDALLISLRDAAEAIEDCGLDPDCYPEPLERFDSTRAALDAIGWGARGDIDVGAHRDALQRALSGRLETERHMMADSAASAAKGKHGAEQERQTAYRYVLQLETLMAGAGLTIPKAGDHDDA